MKNRSKVGGNKGNPAYRTPARFRVDKSLSVAKGKAALKVHVPQYRRPGRRG